jgi:hypothetical protein
LQNLALEKTELEENAQAMRDHGTPMHPVTAQIGLTTRRKMHAVFQTKTQTDRWLKTQRTDNRSEAGVRQTQCKRSKQEEAK